MSEYLNMPFRHLERVADDIGAKLRRVATLLTSLEGAMLTADNQAAYERAASSYAHWEQERKRLSWELDQIKEEIGIRNARGDCA